MTTTVPEDGVVAKMRVTLKLADDWAMRNEQRDGSGLMVQCMDRLGEGSRRIEALLSTNADLERDKRDLIFLGDALEKQVNEAFAQAGCPKHIGWPAGIDSLAARLGVAERALTNAAEWFDRVATYKGHGHASTWARDTRQALKDIST